ncbi:YveK family protein [Turicibacter sanguinis]|uniref:Chain-length determining protein n=1 Tax=Turicibacter sanguinis TaxID=154288 RepID=A0A6G2CPW6_9FIRM|nr:Wzz/FepE/Etk N-terminal domain-containing protein [Turicibacter sanguinis]MTK70797.1 chain-length determining protein [Turicibacter sanguinis]MTK81924.1 chain-length determining protein [Turicibacter sanguinis]MTK84248.1 chain-length determining protein [Turicibacter sanguinis]MTK86694.1 chain-length determining protein [Turicibacter sanguinis]MTK95841.1 chain-length determining protein [Turicibacter sanguinis]
MEEMQYQEMTLEDIFRALKKRWLLIVSVTLMCLIGGSIFVLFFGPEPVYQASTTVLVNYRAEETNKLTQSDLTTSQKLVATYTEIIKSATILEPVIKALDLDMTADELLKNIGVAKVNDTEIIKITVKNEDAELSRDIANTIANVFSKEISKIMKVDSTSTLDVAKTPMTPLSQNKITKIAIVGILGMMISVGLVFVLEYLDRTVKTADETEKLLGVPVLGVIPKSKDLA